MWPGQALGRDIAGDKQTVTKFTRDMFLSYIDRHYQTPNMILGVSGNFRQKELDKLVDVHWKTWPKKKFFGWDKVIDKQGSARLALKFKPTEQAHLSLGFKAYAYGDRRNAAVSVLASVLGGGMSSRLFTEVRERRGLAYYVRTSPGSYQDAGNFAINSGVQVDKIEQAITVILDELKKVKAEPVVDAELQKARDYIKGKSILALEDNQVRLDWFLERAAFFKKILTPQQAFDQIDKVTAAEVQKVARDLFQSKKLTLAIIGPYKDEGKFKRLLKI
jgi:predicted Zn-dependent peptidase